MRYLWLIFLSLAVLIGLAGWWQQRAPAPAPAGAAPPPVSSVGLNAPAPGAAATSTAAADSLVRFALRQIGSPYQWAGTTPAGFDCSGFLMYAYAHVGVPVPHSTALLINTGQPVTRAEARPGDLVIFTGTAQTSTTPGHAGIIISPNGQLPVRFVHSSSARRESGVKISQVEGTDYERRFMQVRRVLGGNAGLASGPRSPAPPPAPADRPRIAAVVAPLEQRPAAVKLADETEPPRPQHLTRLTAKTGARVGAPQAVASRRKTGKVTPKKAVRRATSAKASARRPAKAPAKPRPRTTAKPKTSTTAPRKR